MMLPLKGVSWYTHGVINYTPEHNMTTRTRKLTIAAEDALSEAMHCLDGEEDSNGLTCKLSEGKLISFALLRLAHDAEHHPEETMGGLIAAALREDL